MAHQPLSILNRLANMALEGDAAVAQPDAAAAHAPIGLDVIFIGRLDQRQHRLVDDFLRHAEVKPVLIERQSTKQS